MHYFAPLYEINPVIGSAPRRPDDFLNGQACRHRLLMEMTQIRPYPDPVWRQRIPVASISEPHGITRLPESE
jgi:hypothetical protein